MEEEVHSWAGRVTSLSCIRDRDSESDLQAPGPVRLRANGEGILDSVALTNPQIAQLSSDKAAPGFPPPVRSFVVAFLKQYPLR